MSITEQENPAVESATDAAQDTPVTQSAAPDGTGAPQPPAAKRRIAGRLIGAVAAAAVVFGGAACAIILTSGAKLSRAANNLHREIETRLNETVASGLRALPLALANGTVGVEFDYTDMWDDAYSGEVSLTSNAAEREYLLGGSLSAFGKEADVSAYINAERIAVGSSLLGETHYGLTFETFDEDFTAFSALLGLPSETDEMIRGVVGSMHDALSGETDVSAKIAAEREEYAALTTTLLADAELSTETRDVLVSGKTVSATVLTYTLKSDSIALYLSGLFDLSAQNGTLAALHAGINGLSGGTGYSAESFEAELEQVIRRIEADNDGELTVSCAIVSNRLALVEVESALVFAGADVSFTLTADFGGGVTDDWLFTLVVTDARGGVSSLSAVWKYGDGNNTIVLSEGAYPGEPLIFKSVWDAETGQFTLLVDDGYGEYELSGVVEHADDAFTLTVDSGDSLALTLRAETGAEIDSPAFVNLDRWDMMLLFDLAEALDSFLYY